MIIDLAKFVEKERPRWTEFESLLDAHARGAAASWDLDTATRFYFLYEKVSSDLVKITTFSGERELRAYLGALVARGYSAIHARARHSHRFSFLHWALSGFPETFRKTIGAFYVALLVTVLGCLFGGVAVMVDKDAKDAIFPRELSHVRIKPGERVEQEEKQTHPDSRGHGAFAAYLISNNTRVSINALALGLTAGIGTILLLFFNGVMLGAIVVDYVAAGYGAFVAGWLLPHGVIEIPAILIASQAGLILGDCILRPGGMSRMARLRARMPDIVSLIGGVAMLLVWAGIIESFFSQYHAGVLPYWFKISFGLVEGAVLAAYLSGGVARIARRRPS